jgi:hypothetical protein
MHADLCLNRSKLCVKLTYQLGGMATYKCNTLLLNTMAKNFADIQIYSMGT